MRGTRALDFLLLGGQSRRFVPQYAANHGGVTVKLSGMHINIHTLNSREVKNNRAVVTVTIDVMGRNHLRGVISKLSDINGIEEIKRL